MFIILDYIVTKFIDNQNYEDLLKIEPCLLPNFSEENFPFILYAGHECASIVNIKDGFHQPLINQEILGTTGI